MSIPETFEATIEDFTPRGYGQGSTVKGPVEVAHAIPGDQVLIELRRKKRVKKGRLLEILKASQNRVEPRCSHARMCGGCCWQQMDYQAQIKTKENFVKTAFSKEVFPIIASDSPWHYRNKMEFTFSENRAGARYFGMMIAQAEPYVFNLEKCHLANFWFSDVVGTVRAWWENSGIQAYNPPRDEGSLRYLTLREGMRTGQRMAILNISGRSGYELSEAHLDSFVEAVKETAGPEASIFLRTHQTKKGTPTIFSEKHLSGPEFITEELHLENNKFSFKISPSSFFQPSTFQAEKLYNAALSLLDLEPDSVLYDLYCGTGTLGMAASAGARKVIGIELSSEAVKDAQENLERNKIANMTLLQGDVGKVLEAHSLEKPDAVIVDPPRAGLDAKSLHHIKTLRPSKILYVSCNPKTQAENCQELFEAGYKLKALQPLDQFPHTYHIENIALLTL